MELRNIYTFEIINKGKRHHKEIGLNITDKLYFYLYLQFGK